MGHERERKQGLFYSLFLEKHGTKFGNQKIPCVEGLVSSSMLMGDGRWWEKETLRGGILCEVLQSLEM